MNRGKRVLTIHLDDMRPGHVGRLLEVIQDIYETDVECTMRSDGLAVYLRPWRDK